MPFELKVTFGGLCFYIPQGDFKRVVVLMPDARGELRHEDGTRGRPHVGYLSVDPAHLFAQEMRPKLDGLPAETVFRFHRSHLHFDGLGPADITTEMQLPDVGKFAPCLQLKHKDRLFTPEVPGDLLLLMRTVISGGTLTGEGKAQWQIPHHLNLKGKLQKGAFAGHIGWRRKVTDAAGLTVRITDFAGNPQVVLPLHPVDGKISLNIANLCSENPLEWGEFKKTESMTDDVDFKWFYRLLEPTALCEPRATAAAPTFPTMLMGTDFPVPRPASESTFGREHCIGLQGATDIPGASLREARAEEDTEVQHADEWGP